MVIPSIDNKKAWKDINNKVEELLNNFKITYINSNLTTDEILHLFFTKLKELLDNYYLTFKKTKFEINELRTKNKKKFIQYYANFFKNESSYKKPTCSNDKLQTHFMNMFSYNYCNKLEYPDIFNSENVVLDDGNMIVVNSNNVKKINNDINDESFNYDYDKEYKFNNNLISLLDIINILDKKYSNNKDMFGISYNIFKLLPSIHSFLCEQYNNIMFNIDNLGEHWLKGTIFSKYKKGDTDNPKNFRPIVCIPLYIKIYNKILSKRLTNYLIKANILDTNIQIKDDNIHSNIFEYIMKSKNFIKFATDFNKSLTLTFLDIKNAYGSITFDLLKKVINKYNIPDNVIKYILDYHINALLTVDGINFFNIYKGLKQGCPLSNILFLMCFNIFLKYINEKHINLGFKVDNILTLLFAFVDDVILINNNPEQAKIVADDFSLLLEQFNIFFNFEKIKWISINNDNNELVIDNHIIKLVTFKDNFKYLGSFIIDDFNVELDLYKHKVRIYMEYIDNLNISNNAKLFLYNKYVNRKIIWDMQLTLFNSNTISEFTSIEVEFLSKWELHNHKNYLNNRNNIIMNQRLYRYYYSDDLLKKFSIDTLSKSDISNIYDYIKNNKLRNKSIEYNDLH